LVRTGYAGRDAKHKAALDVSADNLLDAVNLILRQTET
jgi:hypothetical protein